MIFENPSSPIAAEDYENMDDDMDGDEMLGGATNDDDNDDMDSDDN